MRNRGALTMVMLALAFTFICPLAYGQDGGSQRPSLLSAPWEVDIAPYLWVPGIFGDTTVRGRTADIDISAPDQQFPLMTYDSYTTYVGEVS